MEVERLSNSHSRVAQNSQLYRFNQEFFQYKNSKKILLN